MTIDKKLLKSYKDQCGDAIIDELLFSFNDEVPDKLDNAYLQLESQDNKRLKGTLHALKNCFLNVGASIEGSYCQYIEDHLESMESQKVCQALCQIEASFKEVQKELGVVLENLQ